jgi:hypothetical protein
MSRFLVIVFLLAALMLGTGSHTSVAGISGNETAVTAVDNSLVGHGQGETDKQMPSQRCHLLGCSHSFAALATVSVFRADARSAVKPLLNERDRRSTILGRDPPIPRSPL